MFLRTVSPTRHKYRYVASCRLMFRWLETCSPQASTCRDRSGLDHPVEQTEILAVAVRQLPDPAVAVPGPSGGADAATQLDLAPGDVEGDQGVVWPRPAGRAPGLLIDDELDGGEPPTPDLVAALPDPDEAVTVTGQVLLRAPLAWLEALPDVRIELL